MGYGSYSASDWTKLKASRKLSNDKNVSEIFVRTSCNPKFDPMYIGTRECFDSEDHPNSTPIVVGLDVTASMGYLAVAIASGALNDLIMKLYSTNLVEDPALMCAAYGDYRDRSPLQVTQFESDIRIAEQLLELYFENGGNGEVVTTCLWEFLANHTNIDAFNKRGEKGFVFTIGDTANIRNDHVPETIKRVIGDDVPNATAEKILDDVSKKFNAFHIMVGDERYGKNNNQMMNGHKIIINGTNIELIPEIIIGTIRMQKGAKIEEVVESYDSMVKPILWNALSQLQITNDNGSINL